MIHAELPPTPPKPIRLVLVDSQAAVLAKAGSALTAADSLQLVGQAADSDEALQLCQLTNPDAVLINMEHDQADGTELISRITRLWPAMTVLVVARPEQRDWLRAALAAGAAGYLPSDANPAAFASTIVHVARRRQPAASVQVEPQPPSDRQNEELIEAGRIQTSLLPAEPPAIPGWDLAVRLQPARQTSGDFYDFLPLEHGKYGLLVADVSDKGLGAALFMAMANTLFRTYITRQPALPALAMSAVNERILQDTGGSSFVTAFLGVLEPGTGRLRFVNAGHASPVLLGAQRGKSMDRLGRTGMALGILPGATWQQKLVKLASGDLLLCYTDGVPDARDWRGQFYGEQRLLETARSQAGASAQGVVDAVFADVSRFTGGAPLLDDLVLMVLKRD